MNSLHKFITNSFEYSGTHVRCRAVSFELSRVTFNVWVDGVIYSAGSEGFEPSIVGLESTVLPLHQPPKILRGNSEKLSKRCDMVLAYPVTAKHVV